MKATSWKEGCHRAGKRNLSNFAGERGDRMDMCSRNTHFGALGYFPCHAGTGSGSCLCHVLLQLRRLRLVNFRF